LDSYRYNVGNWAFSGKFSKYLVYGAVFLLFEQLKLQVKDGALYVIQEISSEVFTVPFLSDITTNYIFNSFSPLCTLLTSSTICGNNVNAKKELFTKLADLGDLLYRGGHATATDSLLCLVKVATLLDESLSSERHKKEQLKIKALHYLSTNTTDNPSDHPVTYYNTACVYSLFKDFEESKKNFEWCFNCKDGEYKKTHPLERERN